MTIINPNNIKGVNEDAGETAIPTYFGWKQTPFRKGAVHFLFGPKIESDRRFARINTLGTIRLDFKLHRLLGSIREKRNLLLANLTKEQVSQVEIKSGITVTPFIGVDFGRKATAEVVENKKKNVRVVIPQHSILRGYIGFNSTFEWQVFNLPMSFSLEDKLSYLARQEIIGSVIDTGVDLRKVNRFQNRGVASFDLFFNQVRRYSFNISYENGRKAPNFEYLNKVSAGFKIVY